MSGAVIATTSPSPTDRPAPEPSAPAAFSCTPAAARPVTLARPAAVASSRNPLEGAGPLTLVAGGYQDLEAARWLSWDGVLVFADRRANALYQLRPPSTITPCRQPVQTPFGLALDPQGRLLVTDAARVARLLPEGGAQTLADQQTVGRPVTPNDLTVRSDGTAFVTSLPPFARANEELVFRVAPDGRAAVVWETDRVGPHGPNGIALSPDESTLYVGFFNERVVRAFDLAHDGSIANGRIVARTAAQTDGMTVDRAGNLFVSTQQGVQVFAPDGRLWGTISTPQPAFNCAFGGAEATTLYVITAAALYRVELSIPGMIGR